MSAIYGCHNRKPLKDATTVPDGWWQMARHVQARITVSVPDLMSKDCRYTHTDLGRVDAKCSGCKHRAKESA